MNRPERPFTTEDIRLERRLPHIGASPSICRR
ncbi:hypothetical protein ACVI1J_001536 [Bradyrhizobium diazoefficiens]